jgi:hypothetical protein
VQRRREQSNVAPTRQQADTSQFTFFTEGYFAPVNFEWQFALQVRALLTLRGLL